MKINYKGLIIFLIEIIAFILTIIIGYFVIKNIFLTIFNESQDIYKAETSKITANVDISSSDSLFTISKKLEESNIISNKYIFIAESVLTGNARNISEGSYTFSSDMSPHEIFNNLNDDAKIDAENEISITIKEGFTLKDIGEYLESKEIVTAENFLETANNYNFDYDFLDPIRGKENYLEGYLFPDTYRIYKDSSSETIINKMLTRFNQIYDEEMRTQTLAKGLTIDEVVTMASIIEKEIKVPEERELCSSVIYNRLEQDISLGMCSTILYALGVRKEDLSIEETQIESPYNTYINKGLPQGPIASPSKACLEAALNPADTDYLYFVVNDEDKGSHFFTNNYDEFINAKTEYNQKF